MKMTHYNSVLFRSAGKIIVILLSVVILCGILPTVGAEGPVQFDPLEVFRGRIGYIGFALTGMPWVAHEADLEDYWTESILMGGHCGLDGSEYQFRSADISPLIEKHKKDHPELGDAENERDALYDYMTFYIYYYDGETGQAVYDEEEGMISFHYTYPDSPGCTYSAKGYLRGTEAVILLIQDCDHSEKALSLLAPMTADERQALLVSQTAIHEDFMGIGMTFPTTPYIFTDDNGVTMAFCFTRDFDRVVAQYIPMGLTVSADGDELEDCMNTLAKQAAGSLCKNEPDIQNGIVSGSEELWQYDFSFETSLGYEPLSPEKWLGRVYTGEDGMWYLLANDSPAGRGYMDSCDLSGRTEEYTSSGMWIKAEIAKAKDRRPGNEPSTLRQFIKDFYNFLDKGVYRDIMSPDDIEIGGAVYADGRWTRTLTIGSSDLYAVLFLPSDDDNAAVNEIHVLCGEEIDYQYGSYFTAGCIKAAEGTDQDDALDRFTASTDPDVSFKWTGKRYQAECSYVDRSDFHYYLMTVRAAIPETGLPMSEDWSLDSLSETDPMTVQAFFDGWERINQLYAGNFPLEIVDEAAKGADGTEMYSAVFGDSTYIMLVCKDDGKHVIDRIHVFNFEQFPPQTYLGGMVSLAVISRMPTDQFVRTLMMLNEYPLWDDLLNMYPVTAWNGKMLLLDDEEYEGMYIPVAMIATFQKE